MAEGERFELSTEVTPSKRLAGARTRPLCDPSARVSIVGDAGDLVNQALARPDRRCPAATHLSLASHPAQSGLPPQCHRMKTTRSRGRAGNDVAIETAAELTASELANRRGHRRYPAWIDVSLSNHEANTSAPATIVDLSLGGALIQTHHALEAGDMISVTLSAPPGPIALSGMVVRVESSWTGHLLHIEFETLDPASRLAYCRLLDELEFDFRRHQLGIAAARL
jgi:hypothetical protein